MVTSENTPPSRVSSEGGAREGAGKWWGVETPSDSRFERGRVWWWSGSEQDAETRATRLVVVEKENKKIKKNTERARDKRLEPLSR